MTLTPVTLTFDPKGVNSWTKPDAYTKFGWNRAKGLRDIKIWPLTPATLTFQKNNPPVTLLGPTPARVPSLVTIGPRAWEELRDKQTDKQTNFSQITVWWWVILLFNFLRILASTAAFHKMQPAFYKMLSGFFRKNLHCWKGKVMYPRDGPWTWLTLTNGWWRQGADQLLLLIEVHPHLTVESANN